MKESLDVLKWIEFAERDLQIARRMISEYPDDSAFHSQQAAEKALKAVLIKKSGELIKTHELAFLAKHVKAPAEIVSECVDLNELSVSMRYPGADEVIGEYTPEKAVKAAEKVLSWSKKQI